MISQEIQTAIVKEVSQLAVACEKAYAQKHHYHDEVGNLSKLIDGLIETVNTLPVYAEPKHTHSTDDIAGLIPLKKIENGSQISKLLSRTLADADHKHLSTDKALESFRNALGSMQKSLEQYQTLEDSKASQKAAESVLKDLRSELQKVAASIPTLPVEEPELIAIRRLHIPKKCHNRKITEVVGRDENGNPANITMTRSGKEVTVGERVSMDDILILSPALASVRIRFS